MNDIRPIREHECRKLLKLAVISIAFAFGPAVAGQAAGGADDASASVTTDETSVEAVEQAVSEAEESVQSDAPDIQTDPPVAENVDLSEPVEPEEVSPQPEPEVIVDSDDEVDVVDEEPEVEIVVDETPAVDPQQNETMVLLDTQVPPGTSARLSWSPAEGFAGIAVPTPVLVVNGAKAGPTVCLTAAVHGDELNGIEIVRRVLYELDPQKLSGSVIGVPIVNLQGFRRGSRYLPDRRDLNRFFPGNPRGSSASRIAYSFFHEVIDHCDTLVDLHTGSFHRTNLPQLRADLANPQIATLTQGFGSTVVLHSSGAKGTLRRAAADAGIPAMTLEAGEPTRVQDDAVSHGTKGIMTLLNEMHMYRKVTVWGHREPVYYRSTWVRANQGGVLFSSVALGQRVKRGEVLGTVTDPITNVQTELQASANGRVLGMALNQFVMPGFAAFRLGIERSEEEAFESATADPVSDMDDLAEEEESSAMLDGLGETSLDVRDNLEDSD